MIVRTLLLAFLINLASLDDSKDKTIEEAIDDVFEYDKNRDSSIENPRSREFINDSGEKCFCVPYYLCTNGTIKTAGTGILNVRSGNIGGETLMDAPNQPICNNFDVYCCEPRPVIQSCGLRNTPSLSSRMLGGPENSQFGESPWMIAVLKRENYSRNNLNNMVYLCGGALIHESLVLTTAHALKSSELNGGVELIARAGGWDMQDNQEAYQYRDVAEIRRHPNFNPRNFGNDFAILRLKSPFALTPYINTICLPPLGTHRVSGNCAANSWGKCERSHQNQSPSVLQKIDLKVVNRRECETLYHKTRAGVSFTLHESFICAGGVYGSDKCVGEKGSPLACPSDDDNRYELSGLLSWGRDCNRGIPEVYSSVGYAREWIENTKNEMGFQ